VFASPLSVFLFIGSYVQGEFTASLPLIAPLLSISFSYTHRRVLSFALIRRSPECHSRKMNFKHPYKCLVLNRVLLYKSTNSDVADKPRTHLCKCNDVADLTNVIKIHLKKMIPRIRPFKVTQGHWNRHGLIRHL